MLANTILSEPISLLMISPTQSEIDWVGQLCNRTAADLTFHSTSAVETAQGLLTGDRLNVVLFDLEPVHQADPRGALAAIETMSQSAPVIVIVDSTDLRLEQACIDVGAADVLHRQELTPSGLRRSLRYAIAHRTASQQLARLQLLDPATGLAAQPLFWEILGLAVRRAKRNQDFFAVLLVEVKSGSIDLTDTSIEGRGADLLRIMTGKLQQILRASDTIARFDHRQFAILAESMPRIEDVQIVAEKIINELAKPVEGFGQSQLPAIAVGIALYPTSAVSAEGLIGRAGEALQQALTRTHNDFVFA